MPEVLIASAALAVPELDGKVAMISDTRVSGVSHGAIGVHCSRKRPWAARSLWSKTATRSVSTCCRRRDPARERRGTGSSPSRFAALDSDFAPRLPAGLGRHRRPGPPRLRQQGAASGVQVMAGLGVRRLVAALHLILATVRRDDYTPDRHLISCRIFPSRSPRYESRLAPPVVQLARRSRPHAVLRLSNCSS